MALIDYIDKVALYSNNDIQDINKVKDTDMNQIKRVVNQNEAKLLIAVSSSAPAQCSTGDMYFNTNDNLIYTATSTNTWGLTGVAPTLNTIYIVLSTNSIYAYNGITLISVGGGGGVENSYSTSQSKGYSCEYMNGITEPEDFTITPSYSTLSPTYTLKKIGHLVFLNCNSIFLSTISANTWANIAIIPDELKPSVSLTTAAIMASGDTGNITGHGRCELQTNGTIRIKVNIQQSTPMFTFTLVWVV